MQNTISNADDVIDSRDVIARIEELESERSDIECDIETVKEETDGKPEIEREPLIAEATGALAEWDEENAEELKTLLALQSEAEGYSDDWQHGSTLIRRSYFVEYCEELVKDIGDMPKEIPSYIEIDWQKTADNLEADYTSVEFGDVEYLIR